MRPRLVCFVLLACGSPPEPEVAREREVVVASAEEEPAREPPVEEAPPVEEETGENAASEYFPGIAAYPNARFLCSQHITATAGHISWRGYASEDDVGTIRAFYEARAAEGTNVEPDGASFRMRVGDHVVSVHPVAAAHPTCGVDPGHGDRSYFVVSSMVR
jgi:hypothetical protein